MRKKLLFFILLTASTILCADDYSRAGDIVTNHTRGIQWQDTPYTAADEAAYNSQTVESERARQWIHAADYCTNLNLDGGGWRLSTYDELDSVIDTSRSNPAINPIFENALGLGTWSGTTYPENTAQAWGVGFYSGEWHHCTKNNYSKLIMCVREGSSTPPSNQAPIAKAGSDQTVIEGDTVRLDGSASTDPDGTITAYEWKHADGTVLSSEVSFDRIFSVGTRTITLTVTDNDGATGTDSMTVTVEAAAPGNNLPVANAGADKSVQVNEAVSITGSGSDTDGTIASYEWKKGSTVLATTASFDYTPNTVGTDTLTLTVTDNDGATGTDSMTVTVTATPNTPPTADAGTDKTVEVNKPVTITGSGSDTDGTIASYEWKKDNTVLATTASFVYTPTAVGTDTLTLAVTDDDGATGSDSVTVTVEAAAPGNNLPVANAGADKSVQVNEAVSITGSGSDTDGTIASYEWKKDNTVLATTASFVYTPTAVGTDTLTLAVTDNDGATGTDSMTVTVTAESLPPVTEPDWFEETEIDGKTEYTMIDGETSVILDSGITDDFDVQANDDMIFFTAKDLSVIGSCQVKASIIMNNDGSVLAGYTHEGSSCNNDINEFAPGTTVNVGSDMPLLIETPLTDDLTLGGK